MFRRFALLGIIGIHDPAAIPLLELHGPTNQLIFINPYEVTSLREPLAFNRGMFARGSKCIIVMVNGYFIAVQEACGDVREKIKEVR